MNKQIITIISACSLLFLSGCSNVVSKHPVGAENYNTSSKSWDGTWLSEGEFVKIKVMDEPNGIVKLAWIEEKDNDIKFESITCQIKKGSNGLYLNVQAKPDDELTGFYYWGKVKKEKHKILFWLPSVEAFKQASEAKKIQATMEKTDPDKQGKQRIKNIKLLDDPKVILALVEGDGGKYFDLENPIVLVRAMK